MKHAYLIIAHGNWEQLVILLKQIDSENNDVYLHIDKKVKNVPIGFIKSSLKKSKIFIFQEYKVYWGSFELVKVELLLLNKSIKNKYDYYHLMSGMDLLIKNKDEIDLFFKKNKGKEFIHYDTDERIKKDKEILRRVKCYHFFTNYRRKYKKLKILNEFFTFIERISLLFQELVGVNRIKNKNIKIKYGSQWFSITHQLAKYLVSKEKYIISIFHNTKCSDELFVQTMVYNSKFKKRLYNQKYNDDCMSNLRLIDMKKRGKNGNPYTWQIFDYNEILKSKCLFARKFDINKDKEIIEKIVENVK